MMYFKRVLNLGYFIFKTVVTRGHLPRPPAKEKQKKITKMIILKHVRTLLLPHADIIYTPFARHPLRETKLSS